MTDDTSGMTEAEARKVFLYPSGNVRMACSPDNDGYPTCLGDGTMCGTSGVLDRQVCKYVKEI